MTPEARTAARYRQADRFSRFYVPSKLKRDPIYKALHTRGPFGRVLDIGCGRGQTSIWLLESGLATEAIGLEMNGRAVAAARQAAAGLPFRVEAQDLTSAPALPAADTVLIVDVLYQLGPDAQSALLAAVASSAARRVLIRTLDPSGPRGRLTRAIEQVGRTIWPTTGRNVAPMPPAWIAGQFAGWPATIEPNHEGTPFSNVLIDARRTYALKKPSPSGRGWGEGLCAE